MKSKIQNSIRNERGAGDLPVIIVSLSAAIFVIIFVSGILYWLPNWKLQKQLKDKVEQLTKVVTEKNEALGDPTALTTALQEVVQEENQLQAAYSEKAQAPLMKQALTQAFVDEKFQVDHYFFGETRTGRDPLWTETPAEFRVTGPKDHLSKAVVKWRKEIPINVRLLEVDVKKKDPQKTVVAAFFLNALFLAPLESPKTAAQVQSAGVILPPPGYFENRANRERREQIVMLINQVSSLEVQLGETSQIKERQKRLEELLGRRADYMAEREREFDLLSRQLKDILPKLSKGENHRIILKVQETLIEKKAQEKKP